jgi:hypothetical protein
VAETRTVNSVGRRKWLRYGLRTLAALVLICAIAAGWWTQRGRWWRYRLANGGDPSVFWPRLLALSDIEDHSFDKEADFDVWPGIHEGSQNGWVWVRHGSTLRGVTPDGDVLGEGGILIAGKRPKVLWNGTLPDGGAGIALFNVEGEDRYLIFIAAKPYPVVRLLVVVNSPGVSARVIDSQPVPVLELSSNDGLFTEKFSCDAETLTRGKPPVDTQPSTKPWIVRLSR